MKKLSASIVISVAAFITASLPVLAAYSGVVTVGNTGAAYAMLPVSWTLDNASLVTGKYISASGLDVAFNAGGVLPSMLVNDRSLFALPIGAGASASVTMSTGNSPASQFSIIPGYNGYITTADAAALEPANSFEAEVSGYIDTSYVATPKYLLQKSGAIELYVSAANHLPIANHHCPS
jgi:hypothetical protein